MTYRINFYQISTDDSFSEIEKKDIMAIVDIYVYRLFSHKL